VEVNDRHGPCRSAFFVGDGSGHRGDGSDPVGHLCGQSIAHHAAITHATGVDPLLIHLYNPVEVVQQPADEGYVVSLSLGHLAAETAGVPCAEWPHARTTRINDDEAGVV